MGVHRNHIEECTDKIESFDNADEVGNGISFAPCGTSGVGSLLTQDSIPYRSRKGLQKLEVEHDYRAEYCICLVSVSSTRWSPGLYLQDFL